MFFYFLKNLFIFIFSPFSLSFVLVVNLSLLDSNEYSCGGDGYSFLYVPRVEGCSRYEWQVSVTAQYGDVRSETVLNSCAFVAQKSPYGIVLYFLFNNVSKSKHCKYLLF